MTNPSARSTSRLSRRDFLASAGIGGAVLASSPIFGTQEAAADTPDPLRTRAGDPKTTPRVAGLHLQFGADAAREVVVSWHSLTQVGSPRVYYGTSPKVLGRAAGASTVSYTDAKSATSGKRAPVYVTESAAWSAVRDAANSYGFAAFEVDPGQPGGTTSIRVTYYNVTGPYGELTPFETFTLQRPRSDRTGV